MGGSVGNTGIGLGLGDDASGDDATNARYQYLSQQLLCYGNHILPAVK
jgi:hypothetical protein